jgi:hypothetical protein
MFAMRVCFQPLYCASWQGLQLSEPTKWAFASWAPADAASRSPMNIDILKLDMNRSAITMLIPFELPDPDLLYLIDW